MAGLNINYKSIKVNNTNINIGSSGTKVSFVSPYNAISVTMRPNSSLLEYEVRVTKDPIEPDIGVGQRAYYEQGIAADVDTTFTIDVNSTNFNSGDGTYTIGLYGRSSIDRSWDVTYIFITKNNEIFDPSGSDTAIEVYSSKNV